MMISLSWSSKNVRISPGVEPVIGAVDAILNFLFLFLVKALAPARLRSAALLDPAMDGVIRDARAAHPCALRRQLVRLALMETLPAAVSRELFLLLLGLQLFGGELPDFCRWLNLGLLASLAAPAVLAHLQRIPGNAKLRVDLGNLRRRKLVLAPVLLDDFPVVAD